MYTYSGNVDDSRSSGSTEDESWADAESGGQSCLFCMSSDWQWFRFLGSPPATAETALPRFVVTCDLCEQLLVEGDQESVIARAEVVNPGEGAELMGLFAAHIDTPRRPRYSHG